MRPVTSNAAASADCPSLAGRGEAFGLGRARRGVPAFTLVEMVLAIGIAVGMLIIAMLFYRQVADLRTQILSESERLATARLLMDRIAGDLRTAGSVTGGGQEFRGETGTLSFVRVASAVPAAGSDGTMDDRVRITFASVLSDEGTNRTVRGVDRREESLGAARPPTGGSSSSSSVELGMFSTLESTNAMARLTEDPLTELVRFLHFRYWNGAQWLEEWTNAASPPGVEVVLGFDPLPEGASPAEYPFEQFRRVMAIPTAVPSRRSPDAAFEPPFLP
jgi:type II secretory pathway pseudopilin PulG